MKQIFLFLASFFILQSSLFGQVDIKKDKYIVLFNNSIIKGDSIIYKPREKLIQIDSLKYNTTQVRYFKNYFGFYANTYEVNDYMNVEFIPSKMNGKIHIFENNFCKYAQPEYNSYFNMTNGFVYFGRTEGGYTNKITHNYYNKGIGPLKIANSINLKEDLNDNQECVKMINKLDRLIITRILFGCVGGSLLLTSFALVSQNNNATPALICAGTGAVCLFTCYKFKIPINKQITKTLYKYNE